MTRSGRGEPDDVQSAGSRALAADIAELRDFAASISTAAAMLPGDADGLRSELIERADKLADLAREPITVGVVGQFSSGKSLMLGLLMGKPDLLPVADRALTANVTALHLTNSPASTQAARTRAQIHYLTEAELVACVEHMLEVLGDRAEAAGLDRAPVRAIAAIRPLVQLWPALEEWCRTVGWPRAELRLNLLVSELMRLQAAAVAAPALLGWTPSVKPDAVDRALQLPAVDADADPRAFPEPVLRIAGVNHQGGEPGEEQLRATLPLVKRVTLGIDVPADVWNLAGLRGDNEMVLLDFPGLGAKSSGVRDYYLSRRELADVTTILVVINGQAAGSVVPTEFPLMMDRPVKELRDRVLAVIGRFDQLPDYISPELYATESVGQSVTDRTLTDGVLQTVMSDARDLVGLGHDERVAFHSAMVGIHDLDTRHRGRANYSPEFRTERKLDEHVRRACTEADKWRKVAGRLAVDDPNSMLQPSLSEFARDGGVGFIRTLLEQHVKDHGLRNRYADLSRRADDVERIRARLLAAGDDGRAARTTARDAARAPVETLLSEVRSALSGLQDRATEELSDPNRILVGPGKSLADTVAERAVNEVFSWPEWSRLFAAVEKGIITLPKPDDEDLDIPWKRSRVAVTLPQGSDEFVARFQQATETCQQTAYELAWAALDAWVRECDHSLQGLRSDYATLVDHEAQARVEGVLGDRDRWSPALQGALDLSWIPLTVRKRVDRDISRSNATQREAVFPLREHSWFAWNPDIPEDVRRIMDASLSRHQMQPARLRRELVSGVTAVVLSRLGTVQLGIARFVRAALKTTGDELDGADMFIDALAGDVGGLADDPFVALRANVRPTAKRD